MKIRKQYYLANGGDAALYILITIVIFGALFLTGGIYNYKFSNQYSPGAYVPLSPSPDNSQKTLQLHSFKFLYLTPTPTMGYGSGNGRNIIWLNHISSGEFSPHIDWMGGQCSQFSLAEVLNAYKNPGEKLWKIVDVATISQALGVWDNYFHSDGPGFSTLHDAWQKEADFFHMKMNYIENPPSQTFLQKVIDIANSGHPVIATAPNHYIVIWGGDENYVWTLDSSPHTFTWAPSYTNDSVTIIDQPWHTYENQPASHPVTRAEFINGLAGFQNYWGGGPSGEYTGLAQAIILTP